jgi:hypothetical protein
MWQKIKDFLFTDPQSACANVDASATKICVQVRTATGTTAGVEVFHFWIPWIVFTVVVLVGYFYYQLEGRKRFVKGRTLPLNRWILDRIMNQIALLAFVGLFVMASRAYLDATFFAWRFWRYAWLAWGLGIAIYWLVYFVRRYPHDREYQLAQRTNAQYFRPPRSRRKAVAKAG